LTDRPAKVNIRTQDKHRIEFHTGLPKPSGKKTMIGTKNTPLHTPLKTAPKGSGSGNLTEPFPGNGRDPAVFDRLDREIEAEDAQGKETQRRRRPRSATRAGYREAQSHSKRSARAKKLERPESEAFSAAKEIVIQTAQRIRSEFEDQLSRADLIKLVSVFRSAVVPKRKPGRRPKAQVTAALADWKRGVRGEALFRAHIRGWERMSRWRRQCEERALMEAIRSRARRERG
jgi:hypothetical protein